MTQWGLDTLFNPAKRHMDEEKQRLQSTREEVGDSSGGKRIDLESGKVSIGRRTDGSENSRTDGSESSPADEAAEATGEDANAAAEPVAAETVAAEESPARARARARRARKA